MTTEIKFLIFVLLFGSRLSLGQENKYINLDKVIPQLEINKSDCYTDLVIESVLPYSPEKSILVIPVIQEKDEYSVTMDLYVVIIENNSGSVISSFYESNSLISDAMRIEKISFDFAPYKLKPSERAFGIRILTIGSSSPNPYESEELSLFIIKKDKLLRVLNNFSVASYSGEWDTICEGQFTTVKKILIISEKTTNGYFDIIVKNNIVNTTKSIVNDECQDVDAQEAKTAVLHFDGNEYK